MATPAALRAGSLEELKKEPWRLQIQADTTSEQLRALVLRNYRVFIQSNQSANIVKDELTELKNRTEQIMAAIPDLKAFCAGVQTDMAAIVAQHSDIQFVFDHYVQLTELLEIPQLLEACIHNELFDAALDVIQFTNETFQEKRATHTQPVAENAMTSGTNFVMDALVREVAQMATLLREKLLQKLREDLPLAVCVRVVGFLRRLDTLVASASSGIVGTPAYERQLKEEFLRCRSAWLVSLARSIPTADAYQYTIQLIDMKRTSWFDMITQYSAIFGSENVDGKVDPPLCRWATTTVADFIQILMRQLPKIDDFSSLATVLEQSLFFGGSLGRVGVDFRAVLVVYFEDHVFALMAQSWETACQDFQSSLGGHALHTGGGVAAAGSKTPIVLASYRHALANNGSSNNIQATPFGMPNGDEDYSPPRVLMSFPILAELTNALLASFNELRLCTIASLQTRLAKRLQLTLAAVVSVIHTFCQENRLSLEPPKASDNAVDNGTRQTKAAALADAIRDMNEILAKELSLYVSRCFQRLFPVTSSTKAAASPSSSRATLDAAALVEQMRELRLLH